jgi:hypothetical protein
MCRCRNEGASKPMGETQEMVWRCPCSIDALRPCRHVNATRLREPGQSLINLASEFQGVLRTGRTNSLTLGMCPNPMDESKCDIGPEFNCSAGSFGAAIRGIPERKCSRMHNEDVHPLRTRCASADFSPCARILSPHAIEMGCP